MFVLDRLTTYAIAYTSVYVRNIYMIHNFHDVLNRTGYKVLFPIIEHPELFNELERVYGLKADLIAISNYTESILIVTNPSGSCVGCYEKKVIWDIVSRHTGVNVTGYLVYIYIHRYDTLYADSVLHDFRAIFTVPHVWAYPSMSFVIEHYVTARLPVRYETYNRVLAVYDMRSSYVL